MTLKILVVDDYDSIRESFQLVFELCGHTVILAAHADAAVGCVKADLAHNTRRNQIDVILTDYNMPPGRNGIELIREVKKLRPDMIIFLMSGTVTEDIVSVALATGAKKVLRKPFTPYEIVDELKIVKAVLELSSCV